MTVITWVLYDIRQNNIRSKIARICLDKGLYRVQKSVFLGTLNQNQIDELVLECQELIDIQVDSVYIFPMDKGTLKKVKLLGQAFDKNVVSDQVYTIFV